MALCLFSCLSACGCRDCTINRLAFYPPFAGYRFEEIVTPKIRAKDLENNPAKQQIPSSARASQLQNKDTPRLSTILSADNKFYKFILVYEEQELKSSRMHSEALQNPQSDIPNQRQGNNEANFQNLQKNGQEKDIQNQPPPQQVKSQLKQIKTKSKKKDNALQREEEFQQVEDLNLICFKRQNRVGTLICGYHVEYTRRRSDMVVIYSHGNSTDIGYMINQALDVAYNLRTNLIAFDYSGYGQSQGKPSERSCIYDLETIYLLARELGYSPINIILYGQSVGSGPSTFMAAQKRFPIGGLIIHSGFASGLRITQDSLKAYSKKTSSKDFFPNVEFIRKVNAPILIIHGTDDMDIRMHHANELYAQAKRHYTPSILKVEGAGHNDIEHNDAHRKVYFMKLREFAQFLRKNRNALHDAYKITKEGKSEPQDEAEISNQCKDKGNKASVRNLQISDEAQAWKRGFAGDGWSQSFNHIYKGYFTPSREQSLIETEKDQEKNQKIIKEQKAISKDGCEGKNVKEKADMNNNGTDYAVIQTNSDRQPQLVKGVRQSVGDTKNNNAGTSKGFGIFKEDNNKALKGSINDGGQVVHISSQVKGREHEEEQKREDINGFQLQPGKEEEEKQNDFITPQKATLAGKKELDEEDNYSGKDKKSGQADSIVMERVLDSSIRMQQQYPHQRKDSSPIGINENDRANNNNILSSMKQQQQQNGGGGDQSSLNAFNNQSNNNNNNKGSSQIKMNSGLNDPRNISSLWLDQRLVEGQSYQFMNNQQLQQTTSEKPPTSEVIPVGDTSQDQQQTSMAAFHRGKDFRGEESKCEGDDDDDNERDDADDEGNDGRIRSHNVTSVIRKQHNSYFSAYILDNSQGGDFSESIYGSSLLHNTNARERASKTKIIQATGGGGTTPQSQSKIGYRSSQTFFSTRKPSQQQQHSDSQNKQQYGKFSSYQHQPRITGFADEEENENEEEEKEEFSGNVSKNSTKYQHGILDENIGAANNNMGTSRDHTSSAGQKSSLLQVPLLQISEIASDHSNLRENEEDAQKSQIV